MLCVGTPPPALRAGTSGSHALRGNSSPDAQCENFWFPCSAWDLFPRRSADPLHLPDLPFPFPEGGLSFSSLERGLLRAALEKASGNASSAARLLGLSRAAFRYRCAKHRIGLREATSPPGGKTRGTHTGR